MTEAAEDRYLPQTGFAAKLNWLRAGVLGANDGIVSTAGLVVGVAATASSTSTILTAGIAGVSAGAISMAVGEYVSVSTQRDAEATLLAQEYRELKEDPGWPYRRRRWSVSSPGSPAAPYWPDSSERRWPR